VFAVAVLWDRFDHDEVEHAHLCWAVGRGIMPYRDLPQNHVPTLWILAAPLFDGGRQVVAALVSARFAALAAFCGIILLALYLLHQIVDHPPLPVCLMMIALMLGVSVSWEFFRFRPDPFASLATSLFVVLSAMLPLGTTRYALLSGVVLGLAASLSFKVLPLILLVPTLVSWLCVKKRSLAPVGIIVPHALGFAVAGLPMLVWVEHRGLWAEFWKGTVLNNSGMLGLSPTAAAIPLLNPVLWLALVGLIVLIQSSGDGADRLLHPRVCVAVAAGLTLLMALLSPNRFAYNLQSFAAPGICLATVGVTHLLALSRSRGLRLVILSFVLVSVGHSSLQHVLTGTCSGWAIDQDELQALADMASGQEQTCVAFAPAHPVFCRDATRLYLTWDLLFASLGRFSPARRELSMKEWREAVGLIESEKPGLIVNAEFFECALQHGIIGDGEIVRFRRLLETDYVLARRLGGECQVPGDPHRTVSIHVRRRPLESPVR